MDPQSLAADPAFQEAVSRLMPPAWAAYTPMVLLLLMFGGRALQTLKDNGGLVGIFKAIFLGKSSLLLLPSLFLLSSCSSLQTWAGSPAGKVVVSTSVEVLSAAEKAVEPVLLEQAILKAEASRKAVLLQPATDFYGSLTKAAELAVWTSAIEAAQARYKKLTGQRFTPGKNPVLL